MSKKEFYDKYIKDNRTEDEKMMDIIHANARKNKNNKNINKSIKTRKKAIFVSLAVLLTLLIIFVGVLWVK